MVLLLLYATGMTVDEALAIRRCDVDLRRMQLRVGAVRSKPKRVLPIGKDLKRELARHFIESRPRAHDSLVVCSATGLPINRKNLCERFQRLQAMVGLKKNSDGGAPRLQDFRYTFAVHRLRSWLLAGTDLNEVMPSLSAYMGYASLTKSEEFLAYAPERFNDNLQKLSPQKAPYRWTEDPGLRTFLLRL
jgi:site-specific recombinase XerD